MLKAKNAEDCGRILLDCMNAEREIAFAMGWNARQRLREENVVPTRADYEAELVAAKAKWSA